MPDDEPGYSTRRRGKIAQCPRRIRDEINRRLDEGDQGPDILAWVNAQPEVQRLVKGKWLGFEISDNNLSEWFKGGYEDWQEEQTKLREIEAKAQLSLRIVQAAGVSMSEGVAAVAAGKIMTALESAEGKELIGLAVGIASLRDKELAKQRVEVARDRAESLKEMVTISRDKFQWATAEQFEKFYNDARAKEIMDSNAERPVKMDQIIELMFGKPPEEAATPA